MIERWYVVSVLSIQCSVFSIQYLVMIPIHLLRGNNDKDGDEKEDESNNNMMKMKVITKKMM